MIAKANSSIKFSGHYKLSLPTTQFLHGFQSKTQFYKIDAMALLKRKSITGIRKSFEDHLSSTSTGGHHVKIMSDETFGLGISFEFTS